LARLTVIVLLNPFWCETVSKWITRYSPHHTNQCNDWLLKRRTFV